MIEEEAGAANTTTPLPLQCGFYNNCSFVASNPSFKSTETAQTLTRHRLIEMPRDTRNSKKLSSSSTTTTTLKPPQHSSAHDPNIHNNCLSPQKQNSTEKRSLVCAIPQSGSTKFPIFRRTRVREVSTPRRSSRLSLLRDPNANQPVSDKTSDCKSDDMRVLSSNEVEMETSNKSRLITLGLQEPKARVSGGETNEREIINCRKRKRADEATNKTAVEGWTKEQEIFLQRAFFATKPTPNFWKKVSKLVPGKTAQDCFDKINSDQMTPSQAPPRSRIKRINSSPLESSLLSASKLLNPSGPKSKGLSRKQKSHIAHKNVRKLLQKQNQMDRDYEADLFSILEPNMNPSTEDSQLPVKISTPKHSQQKQGFLHTLLERSSSGHKKPLSRLSSCGIDIVSPPVLKQVKNRALHEKYIDQLHCREAKRKAAYARAGKSVAGKENRGEINVQKIDMVGAAKSTIVSDVRDAINQLQYVRADASSASDFDDDGVGSDDDDGGESRI